MTLIYKAPVEESMLVLNEVLDVPAWAGMPGFDELDRDTLADLLGQVGKFAEEELLPLNHVGDTSGCRLHPDGSVATPPGFREAYATFVRGGWAGLDGPAEHGGGGLPTVVAIACQEYLWSSNMSFAMYTAAAGHARVLLEHGSEELQRTYVGKLLSGRWRGAMGLTEPDAGSDLALMRTRAVAREDGSYRITGTKVFTSGGEHDLAENIVQLVLARMDGAPAGTRGISLFAVPKFLPDAQGEPGERNGYRCTRIEQKMGLHGSATCEMSYDGATGYLVGERHQGLRAMFVLLNYTRLQTALLALGASELAYQNAAAYARERLQGRAPGGPRYPELPADPVVVHPDVRRILLSARAFNQAGRALVLWCGLQADIAEHSADPDRRRVASEILALVTPVCKGYLTEGAFTHANACQQVFGGYGYMTETGVEQITRDVRMATVGEGVTAIQALDLINRKVRHDGGETARSLFATIAAEAACAPDECGQHAAQLAAALDDLRAATDWMVVGENGPGDRAAASVDYLALFGSVLLGWMWLKIATALYSKHTGRQLPERPRSTGAVARYYLQHLPIDTAALRGHVLAGAGPLSEIADEYV